ncbi:hypothetical protein FACS189446_6180 [Bacteroidia bacterium]|nr:hypothetical protein FACS189446_6180 [Bacteroidia bacterium]
MADFKRRQQHKQTLKNEKNSFSQEQCGQDKKQAGKSQQEQSGWKGMFTVKSEIDIG